MDRFLQQFSGYVLVAVVIVVCALTGVRNGLDLAGFMVIAFLLSEIVKKNGFYTRFYYAMPEHQAQHFWLGAKAEGRKPGMGIVVLSSESKTPFTALVGINIPLPFGCSWFHTYGWVKSDEWGAIVIRTWLGKGPCTFLYQTSIPGDQIEISHAQELQGWDPMYTHWPHWYQMWPFYLFG